MHLGRSAVLLGGIVLIVLAAAAWYTLRPSARAASETKPAPAPAFVGRERCAACHAAPTNAWTGSHHDLAMQIADASTVLGDFDSAVFDDGVVKSRFFRTDGQFMVNTDGPDGTLADFRVEYTFGVEPLQQYLIALPGGRLQALSIAWDTRPKQNGGQRWFHLYPNESIRHDDPLHWTRAQQNWNYMCAECHSTNVEKAYDPATHTYATTWSEIDVSCEACHGPASNHVEWAEAGANAERVDRGLIVQLDERRGVAWHWDEDARKPVRSEPRRTTHELDACAQCHSRRGAIWPYEPGHPIGDTHRVATLDASLYYVDGQIREEVYEYGSFLQSKMYQSGVTCSDCHEPHSLTLRAPGSQVCLQCHLPANYATEAHHHHPAGSAAVECVECHMPSRTYMGVDARRDHSLKVPRPDLSVAFGTPNACTGCHAERGPGWAAERAREWYGPTRAPIPGEVLAAGERRSAGARAQLLALAGDRGNAGIQRASALARVDRIANDRELAALRTLLHDADPLVRRSAVDAYENVPLEYREDLFEALRDVVRDVRLAAVPLLSPIGIDALSPEQQASLERAKREYVASQRINADRPEAHLNLGVIAASSGENAVAEKELRAALEIDSQFVPAAVNLADLYRSSSKEVDAERVLREALAASPNAGALHHALGLLLVRTGRTDEALASLERATQLEPGAVRYAYVYAVALADTGRRRDSIALLARTLAAHPNDRDVLAALATYLRESGDRQRAVEYADRLVTLEPDDPGIAQLRASFDG